MRRVAALFLTSLLLWSLVAQINHALGRVHMYLWVGGLFIAFAALTQAMRPGLIASLLAGLVCDATAPADIFGTQTLLFAAAHVVVFNIRDRVPRDDTITRVVVALLSNLALFLAFSFTLIHRSPAPAAVWPRLFADLAVSQIFLALVAPWFFALQARTLVLARVERETFA